MKVTKNSGHDVDQRAGWVGSMEPGSDAGGSTPAWLDLRQGQPPMTVRYFNDMETAVISRREVDMTRKHPHHPVTAGDIVRIVGPIGDSVIAQIIATGATAEEVTQANAWLSTRDYFRRVAHDVAHSRIARVYHLLDAERQHPKRG
jgi:hypothetical protein